MTKEASFSIPAASCLAHSVVHQVMEHGATAGNGAITHKKSRSTLNDAPASIDDLFRSIQYTQAAAAIIFDQSACILAVNDFAELLFGCDAEDCVYGNFGQLILRDYCSSLITFYVADFDSGPEEADGLDRKVVVRRQDGSLFFASLKIKEFKYYGEIIYLAKFDYWGPADKNDFRAEL